METRAGTDYISLEMANRDLKAFVESHERLFVLPGAGCSTNSGIPDYRDADGSWKRMQPVRFQAFVADDAIRSRYWARSMIG
jgi:NAD-dependent SIR2 family protein deacetylase